MSKRYQPAKALREALEGFVAGPDRSPEAASRILELLSPEIALPWVDELAYVTKQFLAGSADVHAQTLQDLARVALAQWTRTKRWRPAIPADAKGLSVRWLTAEGTDRGKKVAESLGSMKRLKKLAFGVHEGRLDLRGFVDPGPKETERSGGDLERVDFAGATFRRLRFDGGSVNDCRFDGSTFGRGSPYWPPFSMRSTNVTDSSFRGADLGHALIVGRGRWPRRYTFGRVDFSAANLGRASFHDGRISDCDFSNARVNDAEFSTDMVRCRFAGDVEGLMIHGLDYLGRKLPNRVSIRDVDFTDARLSLCGFRSVDFNGLRLPTSDDLLVVDHWPCVHAKLGALAQNLQSEDLSFSIRFTLNDRPEWSVPPRWATTVEVHSLRRNDSPEGVARFLTMLQTARDACRDTPGLVG